MKKFFIFANISWKMRILVISECDDCCGPMASAFLGDYSSKLEVVSAGRHPSREVNPMVVLAMRECLIDLAGCVPRDLATVDPSAFDVVYECPDLPCPDNLPASRDLVDYIKNESFLFFRSL